MLTNNITLRSDVVPVLFIGGSGGHFLATFLYHARENKPYDGGWIFSKNGHAHNSWKDGIGMVGPASPASDHLRYLIDVPKTEYTKYCASHCSDVSLVLRYFNRVIKTYIINDDVISITSSYIAKRGLDDNAISDSDQRKILSDSLGIIGRWPQLCNKYIDPNNRVLNISWKELIHSSPIELVNNLSKFTNIPENQFSISRLLEWRHLTLSGIEKIKI